MNCPNCGTSNLDNAAVCVNCGRSLSAPAASSYTPPPPPKSDFTGGSYGAPPPAPPQSNTAVIIYLVFSILMLLCCCNPLALVPLIFAIISISRRNAGDYAGAQLNAGRTTLWFWITVGVSILLNIIFYVFMGGAAILEEMQRNMGR